MAAAQDPFGTGSARMLSVELLRLRVLDPGDDIASRLSGPVDVGAEIRRLEQTGRITIHERISITTLENQQSIAQFGKRIPLVTGETVAGGRHLHHTEYIDVGTLMRVNALTDGDVVFLELVFDSSWPAPGGTEPDPPLIETIQVETTLRMLLGETVLVSSNRFDLQQLLAVTVTPRDRYYPPRGRLPFDAQTGETSSEEGRLGEPGPEAEDRITAYATGLLRRYDENEDGVVQRVETGDSAFGRRFDDYDGDADGRVTLAEVIEYLKSQFGPD